MSFFQRFMFTQIISGIKTVLPTVPPSQISIPETDEFLISASHFFGNVLLLKGKDHYSLRQDAKKNETQSRNVRG